jgi:hypothetical protein
MPTPLIKSVIRNGFIATNNSIITGSLISTQGVNAAGGFTGSLLGTALSASMASYVKGTNVDGAVASATSASMASYVAGPNVDGAVPDSDKLGGANAASYALNTALTGFATTSSLSSYALSTAITGFATTGSNTFAGNQVFNGNITVNGTGSFTYLNTTYESASIIYSSGSNQFGDASNDVQTLMGTVIATGSLQVTGSVDIFLGGGGSSNLSIAGNQFSQTYLSTNGVLVLNPGSGGVGMAGTSQYMTAGYFVGQTAGTSLTGSFSGSFKGDGSALTGVTATAIFPTTAKSDLASTDQFYVNDGANKYITYSNLVTDLAGTNLVADGPVGTADSLALNTTITGLTSVTSTHVTASYIETVNYISINGGISKTFAGSGSFNPSESIIISVDANVYPHNAIFVKYVLWNYNGEVPYSDMRAGTIMTVIANGGAGFNIAESTTQDIGDTSTIDFTVNVSGTSTEIIMDTSGQGAGTTIKFEYTLL